MPKSKHRKNRKPYDAGKLRNLASILVGSSSETNIKGARINAQGVIIDRNGKPTNYYVARTPTKVGRLRLLRDTLKFLNENKVSLSNRIPKEEYVKQQTYGK